MITPDAAWSIVLSHARPLESVSVSLTEARGYCLAEDIRADRSLPPADRSAMDGYAVRHDDLKRRPCILRIIGEVAAGSFQRPRVKTGTCVRILTGANIPPGADTVVMVEQTQEHTGLVAIRSLVQSGSNILRQGEDARKGSLLLRRGARMDTAQVGVCAGTTGFRRPAAPVRRHLRASQKNGQAQGLRLLCSSTVKCDGTSKTPRRAGAGTLRKPPTLQIRRTR